jgi:hypothetical protein
MPASRRSARSFISASDMVSVSSGMGEQYRSPEPLEPTATTDTVRPDLGKEFP